jgi:phage terminase large subunit-like protein
VPAGLSSLTAEERRKVTQQLTDSDAAFINESWEWNGRENQFLPPGDWPIWLILAGRGFGKTRIGAEAIRKWVCGDTPLTGGTFKRIALVGETAADVRDVMVEGGKRHPCGASQQRISANL